MYLTKCSQPFTLHSSQKHPGLFFFFFFKKSGFSVLFPFSEAFICEVWLRVGHNLSQRAFVQVNNPSLTHHRQPVVGIIQGEKIVTSGFSIRALALEHEKVRLLLEWLCLILWLKDRCWTGDLIQSKFRIEREDAAVPLLVCLSFFFIRAPLQGCQHIVAPKLGRIVLLFLLYRQ